MLPPRVWLLNSPASPYELGRLITPAGNSSLLACLKKLSPEYTQWLLRQREKKAALRNAVNERRKHRRRTGDWGPNLAARAPEHDAPEKKPKKWGVEISLPEQMDLETNFEDTVKSLHRVRLGAQRQLRVRYVNFNHIRHISPSASLLLASEIDRWNQSIGGRLKADDGDWDVSIKKHLCEMGLFELLGMTRPGDVPDGVATTFLPFLHGNVDERTNAGAHAKALRQSIEKVAGTAIRKHLLSDGLTEAATNVCHHAYRKRGRRKRRYKPWWMSAAFTAESQTITVSFFDHGLTIPGTLPASEKMERWKKRLGAWDDGQRIRAAMTLGRSATGKHGRGKGLRNFLELITGHSTSRLTIWSRKGKLVVRNRGGGRLSFTSTVLPATMNGTLIEWQFVPNTATDVPFTP